MGGGISRLGLPAIGLSPRGRGNPLNSLVSHQAVGSIPAWAGEPIDRMRSASMATVYPRVGGGTDSALFAFALHYGLSPRGRGNPDVTGS